MRRVHAGCGAAAAPGAAPGAANEAAIASPTLAAIIAGHVNRLAGNSGTSGASPCCCFLAMVETGCRFDGFPRSTVHFV